MQLCRSFQPLHGIDHKHLEDHEDHEDHEHPEDHEHASEGHHGHDHNDMPNLPDFSLCAHEINVAGDLLVSSLNAPECPLMDFDEAQNFCLDHGMRSVSLSSSLSFDERMHKLDIAELTLNGFWTIGFIENPNKCDFSECTQFENLIDDLFFVEQWLCGALRWMK